MQDIFGVCKRCGEKHLIGIDGICCACWGDIFAQNDIEDGETEFFGEDEIRCPWCGKRIHHDGDESVLCDGGDETCPHCGKRYRVTAECHWTYGTTRL